MSYQSRVTCDRCPAAEEAPQDGGFPFGWSEINHKPSQRGPQVEKRRRLHLCDRCTEELTRWMAEKMHIVDKVSTGTILNRHAGPE